MSTRVKICGLTNLEDALSAIDLGADFLGFNFYPQSKRYIPVEDCMNIFQDLPPAIPKVGVFVNADPQYVIDVATELQLDYLQFHGDETASYCNQFARPYIRAIRAKSLDDLKNISEYEAEYFLIDAFDAADFGGTGKRADWELAKKLKEEGRPVFLAGGLSPDNVVEAIQKVLPFAVDVASGVERPGAPHKKDYGLVSQFIRNAKKALVPT